MSEAHHDIDAWLWFTVGLGFRGVALLGHSLGARKVAQYQAEMPQITERGESRAAALSAVEKAIRSRLRNVEFVDLEIPNPSSKNPWLETAGMFADDPDLESITEEIYKAHVASRDE